MRRDAAGRREASFAAAAAAGPGLVACAGCWEGVRGLAVETCPILTVAAPAERVWGILLEPEGYASWWDAETVAVVPPGPAAPGQEVRAVGRALGRAWPLRLRVTEVGEMVLSLRSELPFGLRGDHRIGVRPQGAGCLLSFG